MPTTTYQIIFYDRSGARDSAQHCPDGAVAWGAFRLFSEPDSAEVYSRITLTTYDWMTGNETTLATLTF